jgi:2-oxoglutarate ferredoxin oxidoreductase subunit gamma
MVKRIIIAGFGGQGVLFAGKILAQAALLDGKEVTWLPSYGPEMRGGTANCRIVISDREISSPAFERADILIAMNKPSLNRFIDNTDGEVITDTSSAADCKRKVTAADTYGIMNMTLLGIMVAKTAIVSKAAVIKAIRGIAGVKADEDTAAFEQGFNMLSIAA